jgi:hypothetical protein
MDAEEQYAYEKMRNAVDTLATGAGAIRVRLHDAFLGFHTLTVTKFADPELKELFATIMKGLRIVDIAPAEQGTVQASLQKMSDDDCVEIAENIWRMYSLLNEKFARHFYGSDDE